MVTSDQINHLLLRIVANPYEDISTLSVDEPDTNPWLIKPSTWHQRMHERIPKRIYPRESEMDKEFFLELYDELYERYHHNPQRARQYHTDVVALYKWMKGRHPNIHEIAEGLGWSLQKSRAVVKIAREFRVIRVYSKNPDEYQLVYRYDLTDEFRWYRRICFLTPSEEYPDFLEYTDICDFMGEDYSKESLKWALDKADELSSDATRSTWWMDMIEGLKKRYWASNYPPSF